MKGHFVEVKGEVLKGGIVQRLPWLQGAEVPAVWQVAMDSMELSRNPGMQPLSTYLQREVALGHIVRQELASMIPAVLLAVESHHCVLDVCAAPGSKTEQLLHAMTSKARALGTQPSGVVVANDADTKRIQIFKTRYQRALAPHLLVVNSRAEDLHQRVVSCKREQIRKLHKAMMSRKAAADEAAALWAAVDEVGGLGEFDRIVADVPCSGDGTVRKFPHIWRLFRPRNGLDLHMIQLQIAKSSVLMLKPGGRMVYSTCSMNPMENEAVVSGLLRHFNKRSAGTGAGVDEFMSQYGITDTSKKNYSLRLVDTRSSLLPRLNSRPGLQEWQSSKEVLVDRRAEKDDASYERSLEMLPPVLDSMTSPTAEERRWMCLEHCHRILPQDMDTGGFFVAVLEFVEVPVSAPAEAGKRKKKGKKGEESAIATNRSGGSAMSATASAEVMARLGYNPNVLATATSTTSADKSDRRGKKNKDGSGGEGGKSAKSKKRSREMTTDADSAVANQYQYSYHRLAASVQASILADLGVPSKVLQEGNVSLLRCTGEIPENGDSQGKKKRDKKAAAAAALTALRAQQRQEREKQLMFGSKMNGWSKGSRDSSSGDAQDREEDTQHRLPSTTSTNTLISAAVEQALATWACSGGDGGEYIGSGSSFVVSAGVDVSIAETEADAPPQWLEEAVSMVGQLIGTPGEDAQGTVVRVDMNDFRMLSQLGSSNAGGSEDWRDEMVDEALQTVLEVAAEDGDDDDDVFPLSASSRTALQKWANLQNRRLEKCGQESVQGHVILALDDRSKSSDTHCGAEADGVDSAAAAAEMAAEANGSSRGPRLSKMQRKKLKATGSAVAPAAPQVQQATVIPPHTGGETVLVLKYLVSRQGVVFAWTSPVDLCESFASAFA